VHDGWARSDWLPLPRGGGELLVAVRRAAEVADTERSRGEQQRRIERPAQHSLDNTRMITAAAGGTPILLDTFRCRHANPPHGSQLGKSFPASPYSSSQPSDSTLLVHHLQAHFLQRRPPHARPHQADRDVVLPLPQPDHLPHDYCWHSWKNATQTPAMVSRGSRRSAAADRTRSA